jgi:hypothetical protein
MPVRNPASSHIVPDWPPLSRLGVVIPWKEEFLGSFRAEAGATGAEAGRLLSGKFPSLRNSEYGLSSSPRKILLKIAVEFRRINLSSPPAVSYSTTTLEQIALREILLLEEIKG